jgi:hypothetical protein
MRRPSVLTVKTGILSPPKTELLTSNVTSRHTIHGRVSSRCRWGRPHLSSMRVLRFVDLVQSFPCSCFQWTALLYKNNN